MNLRFKHKDDIIINELAFADKAAGLTTHASDPDKPGLCEILERELGQKLYVVHRLDKTTTGVMAFALTEAKAAEISELFKQRKIEKKYLFITDRSSEKDSYEVFSQIEKQDKVYISKKCAPAEANAHTVFRRRKRSPFFETWEAYPRTGRPHQIRLHAKELGLPILGDTLYGGKEFPHLCLHANELNIPGYPLKTSLPPQFFEKLGMLKDPELIRQVSAFDQRQRLFNFLQKPQECFRLLHTESSDYRVDVFGPIMWVYWYKEAPPSEADLKRWRFVSDFCGKKYILRHMLNRGKDPNQQSDWCEHSTSEPWIAEENDVKYEFRYHQGLSPGLFLDQRKNRLWLKENSKNKKVLNLFSYTCGFSLVAALGGASEVVSVDLSKKFLDWGQRNFQLNDLDPKKYEFYAQDSLKFFKVAEKRGRKFDIIICDPPSFSRSADGIFKIDKEFENIFQSCLALLNPKGQLLLSSNFEKWDLFEFEKRIRKINPKLKIQRMLADFDFEWPHQEPLMKGFLIQK